MSGRGWDEGFSTAQALALYDFEVINLLENPTLAEEERILATPVLIKKLPEPMCRIIGDLSDRERILVGLDLYERGVDKHLQIPG
jgi:hypothetical protein